MWIKKIKSSLYSTVIARMLFATLISIILLAVLIFYSEILRINQADDEKLNEKNRITKIADDIQAQIKAENMSYDAADNINWDDEIADVDISLMSYAYFLDEFEDFSYLSHGITDNGLSYSFADDLFLFNIMLSDKQGYLLIRSEKGSTTAFIYYILSAVISIVFFFMLSIHFLKPTLNYIKKIELGVKEIATHDLTYKIEVVGENELTSLANEINNMGQQIYEKTNKEKQLDQSQKMLITNISHDLRTPLTSILGYINLIKKEAGEKEKVMAYSGTAEKNAKRLEKLINDLFLYTKLTSGDIILNMVKVDINLIIKQMLELRKRSYHLSCAENKLYTQLDIDKFNRVFDNLLINAEKYSAVGTEISINTFKDKNNVFIEIKNETESDLSDSIPFLMDRLYVGNVERKEGSSGLGLTIAKDMVQQMNGNISLSYKKGFFVVTMSFPISE